MRNGLFYFIAKRHFIKTALVFSLLWGLNNTCFAQLATDVWTKVLNISPYNTFKINDQIALVGTDEEGKTVLRILAEDGTEVETILIPQVELLGSSLFDPSDQSLYLMGTNEDITSMQLLKIKLDGTVIWQKNRPFNNYRFPYSIVQKGAQLAFTFGELNLVGESTGIGWWLLDTAGTLLHEYTHTLTPSSDIVIPYESAFDATGRLIMTASNLQNGKCSVFAFEPEEGTLFWEKPFLFPIFSTIQGLLTDSEGNTYFTGENGFFVKLNAEGETIFNQQLGYDSISIGNKILEHQGDLYVLGGWRDNFNSFELNGKMLIGKYSKSTGAQDWISIYEHTGILNGPIANDGFFKDDSTLIIQFSRLFESDWIGAFRLTQPTAVNELKGPSALTLCPNPTTDGIIRLEGIDSEGGRLKVFSANGVLELDLPYLPTESINLPRPGSYLIEYSQGNDKKTGKVISIKQ